MWVHIWLRGTTKRRHIIEYNWILSGKTTYLSGFISWENWVEREKKRDDRMNTITKLHGLVYRKCTVIHLSWRIEMKSEKNAHHIHTAPSTRAYKIDILRASAQVMWYSCSYSYMAPDDCFAIATHLNAHNSCRNAIE